MTNKDMVKIATEEGAMRFDLQNIIFLVWVQC
jgi:hypothetical protein